MAESNAWRLECCNLMTVTMAEDARAQLLMTTTPIHRKGFVGHTITLLATNEGRVLATCRHEVRSEELLRWCERVYALTYMAISH